MLTEFEKEHLQSEADRLRSLADTIEGKIPNYKDSNPSLAAKAQAQADDYRQIAAGYEEKIANG